MSLGTEDLNKIGVFLRNKDRKLHKIISNC